ncbi:MAG TPA: hypothetical protein VMB82_11975, partial [Acidimicrobiales bacterium]|nr:hypothetical protein [Acidimicrobiales bacterium]
VDLAADSGGNCELTEAGKDVVRGGATIVGMANPPSGMPTHASFLYARNVMNLLALLGKDGTVAPDWDDEIVTGTCVLREGKPAHGPTAELLGLALVDPGSGPKGGTGAVPGQSGGGGA